MAKSLPGRIGDVNMRGKLTKPLGCGCCVAENFKEKLLRREQQKEIHDSIREDTVQKLSKHREQLSRD